MVQPIQHVVYAIHEYEIPGKAFLQLKAGDVVYVEDADASGWWLGTNLRRQRGVFPSTYTLPYVLPPPSEDIVHDARLMLLAANLGADLTSGVPLPLMKSPEGGCEIDSSPSDLACLRRQLSDQLGMREHMRRRVMESLSALLKEQLMLHAEHERGAELCTQQEELLKVQRQMVQEKTDIVGALLREMSEKMSTLSRRGFSPPLAWHEGYNAVRASVAVPSAAFHLENAWRETLTDIKAVLHQREIDLTQLSASCKEAEEGFATASASLMSRIAWRDRHVTQMLAYWEEQWKRIKNDYTMAKAQRGAAETALQQKSTQLRCALEEGRACFFETRERCRQLKRQTEEIAAILQQKAALDVLARKVASVERDIDAYRTKQPGISVSSTER